MLLMASHLKTLISTANKKWAFGGNNQNQELRKYRRAPNIGGPPILNLQDSYTSRER